jgi:hypothetical protein
MECYARQCISLHMSLATNKGREEAAKIDSLSQGHTKRCPNLEGRRQSRHQMVRGRRIRTSR